MNTVIHLYVINYIMNIIFYSFSEKKGTYNKINKNCKSIKNI